MLDTWRKRVLKINRRFRIRLSGDLHLSKILADVSIRYHSMEAKKSQRNPNFSGQECLSLANIMGEFNDIKKDMTNFDFVKHRFTEGIL